jgi:OOP family OmpA-OmpF porin
MKPIHKAAIAFACASLSAMLAAQELNNWTSADGSIWRDAAGECWRDASWTPASAAPGCDGALAPKMATPEAAPAPAPVAAPATAAAPVAAAPVPLPVPVPAPVTKVTYAADTFFDFDKAVLKPEGKAKLDEMLGKLTGIKLEVMIVVGHTDAVGSDAYNLKLSVTRSAAVRDYLVSKGIRKNDVYTEGKGKSQPAADNKTAGGRAKNRRVQIEVVGTRSN